MAGFLWDSRYPHDLVDTDLMRRPTSAGRMKLARYGIGVPVLTGSQDSRSTTDRPIRLPVSLRLNSSGRRSSRALPVLGYPCGPLLREDKLEARVTLQDAAVIRCVRARAPTTHLQQENDGIDIVGPSGAGATGVVIDRHRQFLAHIPQRFVNRIE